MWRIWDSFGLFDELAWRLIWGCWKKYVFHHRHAKLSNSCTEKEHWKHLGSWSDRLGNKGWISVLVLWRVYDGAWKSREWEDFRRWSGEGQQSKRYCKCWTLALRGLADNAGGIVESKWEEWCDCGEWGYTICLQVFTEVLVLSVPKEGCAHMYLQVTAWTASKRWSGSISPRQRVASCGLLLMSLKQVVCCSFASLRVKESKTLWPGKIGHWVWKAEEWRIHLESP